MQNVLLLVNPRAGQRKAKWYLMGIAEILSRAGCTVLLHITAGPGDGEAAVLRHAGEIDRVICCGGDGTFNEAMSGVLKSGKDLPIGYIPAGSTNDFAASLKLSTKPLEAARIAAEGSPTWQDMGQFEDRYFSYVASFGAFTRASYATPQSMKNVLGHAAYVLSGIQELSQLRSYPMRFTLADGRIIAGDFLFGAVSNATSIGGILTLSPDQVDLSDGSFELLLIRTPKDGMELAECVKALQQKTYNCAMLTFLSTPVLSVEAPADMAWTLDGEEEPGHSTVQIRCLHRAVRVLR